MERPVIIKLTNERIKRPGSRVPAARKLKGNKLIVVMLQEDFTPENIERASVQTDDYPYEVKFRPLIIRNQILPDPEAS